MLPAVARAPQRTALGEPHYSNLGYVLAGHVLAVAAGRPFESVVRAEVIEPLGLEHTHYFVEDVAFERLAAGYRIKADRPERTGWERPRARGPNGGVLSCARDLLCFARAHLADDALRGLMSAQGPGGSLADALGLAWNLRDFGGVELAGHDGASSGFRSDLWLAPAHGAAFVQLANSDRGRRNVERLQDAFARALGGSPQPPAASGLEEATAAELSARFFSRWAGLVTFRFDGGALRLRWWGEDPEPLASRVVVRARDHIELVDEPVRGVRGDLIRRSDGAIEWLRLGGRLLRPYAPGAPIPELEALLKERAEGGAG